MTLRPLPRRPPWQGDIFLTSRQIKTGAGGDIHLIAPGGGLTVGFPVAGARPDQGILTEGGGNIHIFTHESVAVGSSRIFTLRGGNEIIWSSTGDIAAVQVLNAANIQVGGTAGGVPVTTVAPPNIGALSGAAAATGATTASVADTARQQARGAAGQDTLPSIITVEVIGFGGADPDEDDHDREA